MKYKVLNIFKPILFLTVGIVMFLIIQQIFIPNYEVNENVNHIIDGFDALDDDSIDYLILGASGPEFGIIPTKIYGDVGICGYNLATSEQCLETSYILLKRVLRKQKPEVIFLDSASLFFVENSSAVTTMRCVMDNLPFDKDRMELAIAYGKHKTGDGFVSALFPIIKYHTRWTELSNQDFKSKSNGAYYTMGYWIESRISGNSYTTLQYINDASKILNEENRIIISALNEIQVNKITIPAYTSKISEDNLKNLQSIKELCDEYSVKLSLITTPNMDLPQLYKGAITETKRNMIIEVSNELDIDYYDMLYDYDAGIDWNKDTCDGGHHLNIRGAEKYTELFENILTNNFNVLPKENSLFDQQLLKFENAHTIAMLQTEQDLPKYLEMINENKSNLTVLIAACDDYIEGMSLDVYNKFKSLGLPLIREGTYRDAYVGVLDKGEAKYEAVSGRKISYNENLNNLSLKLNSAGWNVGPSCEININGKNYAIGGRGLNIVVFDNESGLVIDSVRFDTNVPGNNVYRNNGYSNEYLRAYEEKMCF